MGNCNGNAAQAGALARNTSRKNNSNVQYSGGSSQEISSSNIGKTKTPHPNSLKKAVNKSVSISIEEESLFEMQGVNYRPQDLNPAMERFRSPY